MNAHTTRLLAAASAAALLAGAASAQTTTFSPEDRAQDSVEDIEENVADDFERDVDAFGNNGRKLGWTGSVSMRATASSGNSESVDVGVGTRAGYYDGLNGHEVTLSYSYSEEDGVQTEDSLLAGYDYTRDFGPNTYFYVKGQLAKDEFSSYDTDAFVGAGVGYRVLNTAETQWSIAAGPGYRYLEDNAGNETEEGAFSFSSNYTQNLTDAVFVTNDTDVIYSESDTSVNNELGLNVAMSEVLALRTSLLTEYHTDPAPGYEDTDNTLGASVVYTFN